MSQTNMLAVLAGAALSATALAQSSDANRAYAAELSADAGSRSSFRADGGAGYDAQGFNISSGDGANTLYIFGSAQIRYNMDFGDDGADDPNFPERDDFTGGFEVGLGRLGVHGNVWDKALTYQVRGDFGGNGDFSLETAFAQYAWDNGFALQFGQFKHPLLRESMIDNEYQLAVNRSIAEAVFGGGYVQGFQLKYAAEAFRVWAGFTDGIYTANTPYNSSQEADWAFNARAEFKAMGNNWERFDDFTSWRSAEDMGLIIGAAAHYQDSSGDTGGVVDTNSILDYTIDAQFEGKGFNVFAAFYGNMTDANADDGTDTDNYGAVIQAGVFLTDQVELFGRWDMIMWDSSITDGAGDEADDNHFITAGVNYYLSPESHAAKFTADVIYSLEGTALLYGAGPDVDNPSDGAAPLYGNTTYGLLGQSDDGEFGVQLQFQVVW